jgi:hypothetical protein
MTASDRVRGLVVRLTRPALSRRATHGPVPTFQHDAPGATWRTSTGWEVRILERRGRAIAIASLVDDPSMQIMHPLPAPGCELEAAHHVGTYVRDVVAGEFPVFVAGATALAAFFEHIARVNADISNTNL